MTSIREINCFQYIIELEECRTSLSDFYVFTRSARILEALDDGGRAVGMLLWHGDADVAVIDYVAAIRPREHIASALIEYLADMLAEKGVRTLVTSVTESSSARDALAGLMRRCGFAVSELADIYRCDLKGYESWKNGYLKRHGRKLLDYLEGEGFAAYSFRDAPPEILAQVRDPGNKRLDRGLDIAFIAGGGKGGFSEEASFVAVRDGLAVACCLVCRYREREYVVEALAVREDYQRSGVILLPFAGAVIALGELGAKSVRFTIHRSNTQAVALTKRFIRDMTDLPVVACGYERRLNG